MDNSGAIDKVEMVKVMEAIYSMVDGNMKVETTDAMYHSLQDIGLENLFVRMVVIVGGAEGRNRGESLQACGTTFQDDRHRWGWKPHSD